MMTFRRLIDRVSRLPWIRSWTGGGASVPVLADPEQTGQTQRVDESVRLQIRRALNIAEFLESLSEEDRERFAWRLEERQIQDDRPLDEPAD
jgi:hypothetical protein